MAVQEQTPYSEHTGNGVTKSFALNFDCESKDHLIVLVDDIEPPIATWSLTGGNVVFTTAPAAGKKITAQRNTPFSRNVDYQSYNNSFRPPAVNKDFDWIWWKLQELGVADWILGARIDALKNYVDRKDDELKAYLMEEIRKQGVALDQLDEYYNYLMERLAQIAVDKGWDASFVVDGDKTQKQINDNQEKLNTITNKTGTTETLAESVDATPFLQALISAMPDGMTLDLLGKTFRVKKNTGFISDYPNGDQPCLVVKDKKNITITNGKLIVKEHGQGVFEFVNSTVDIKYLQLEGAGNFPPLDGLTGRGEKSAAGTGWFDYDMYMAGDPKNNSVDTSQKTTGGFGGNFPQWGGGTSSTWGMWNGGFIRNYGHGIYTNNSQVTVDNCEIFGFNGSGVVATGGLGDALSTRVSVTNSDIHHCYTAGVEGRCNVEAVNRTLGLLDVHNNYIHDIGHPDALPTHVDIDPGYGICTSNNYNKVTGVKRYSVTGNRIYNCKRKAVDAHHSYSTIVDGNEIRNTGLGIMIGISSANDLEDVVITNNVLRNIQYTKTHPASAIAVANFMTDPSTGLFNLLGTATISNNQIYEVGLEPQYQVGVASGQGRAIDTSGLERINVTGNIIVNKERIGQVAINAGVTNKHLCVESIVSNNSIRGKWLTGTFQRNTNNSDANTKGLLPVHINTGNIVFLDDLPLTVDQVCVYGDDLKISGNVLRLADPSASDKLVVSSVPTGSSVTLAYDVGTKTLQPVIVNASYAVRITTEDFSVSYSNHTITFTLPTYLSNMYSATVQGRTATRSSTLYVNRFNVSDIAYGRTVSISLLNVSSSGAQTAVNVTDVVSGVFAVTFGL